MKQTKAEKIETKKKQITDALMRCLERDVYSRITVQDVADEAGFSKGGLLYYYPTKEELYLDLMNNFFSGIEHDHLAVIKGNLMSNEKAGISALYGIEKFVMDRKTI
ncbi:MAG TPA: TetR/AcrR family transcriptional regulator, partial [Spirochaetota bacterium]|nr:TetR/AcrR family transcriptional regulator [Spirochaetota bacterium]